MIGMIATKRNGGASLGGFAPAPVVAPHPLLLLLLVEAVMAFELQLYYPQDGGRGVLVGLYASVVWTLPLVITCMAACGAVLAGLN